MAFDKDLRALLRSLKKESRPLAYRLLSEDQKRSKGDPSVGSSGDAIVDVIPEDAALG